jgi:hypothetical protein
LGSNQLIVYTGDGGQGADLLANRLPTSYGRWLARNRLLSAERPVRRGSTSVLTQPHKTHLSAARRAVIWPFAGPLGSPDMAY